MQVDVLVQGVVLLKVIFSVRNLKSRRDRQAGKEHVKRGTYWSSSNMYFFKLNNTMERTQKEK